MHPRRHISPFQFALLIAASYMGFGIFQFPRELVLHAGPDALWGLLLEFAWALAALSLWFRVNRLHPDRPLFAFLPRYLPRSLTDLVAGVTVALHLLLAVVALANFGFLMRTYFLPETPLWAIDGAFVLTAVYIAWYDIAPLARTLETVFTVPALLSIFIGLLLIGRMRFGYALLPTTRLWILPTLRGAYYDAYLFFGFEITMVLYPLVRAEEQATAERYALWAMVMTCAFFLFGYAMVLGVEGPFFLARIQWPTVSANRLVDIEGLFVNKLGLLVVVLWGLMLLAFLALRLWCVIHDVMPSFGSHRLPAYRLWLVTAAALTLSAALAIPSIAPLSQLLMTVVLPAMLGYILGLPLFILAAARFAHRRRPPPRARRLTGTRALGRPRSRLV
ncbi:MAG: spore germination protein [Firmicutes bacterium]|nr:GerAB/ArcD/ProY family transporter [Alicyclobacillaceae bacterium]MCL6497825.1 spore germination protein [Bacillota bacterium]